MPRIQVLSQSLINKIAAGEVIERPASVVKELMENSIDAGATRIDVAVERGGMELIAIADNGCGIAPEEMLLAVTSHATSKLVTDDDLFSVATMGFRGEALASVAEVSRLCIQSRVNPAAKPKYAPVTQPAADIISGMEIEVAGGTYGEPTPCGGPPGTRIEVRNLFFNTPVRKKFLKTVQTELGHTTEVFQRLALANPGIHFTLRHNGRVLFDLSATDDFLQRIRDIEGAELADALIAVQSEHGDIRIHGYVAHPNYSRSNPKLQYLFLNGRPIRDRSLQHALNEAYRGLLTVNRYPISFLQIEMPAAAVDVNVHPTKMEVRFQDSGMVYSQLLSTLRTKFLASNLSTFVSSEKMKAGDGTIENLSNIDPWNADADFAASRAAPPQETPWRQQVAAWPDASSGSESNGWGQRRGITGVPGEIPAFRPFEDRGVLSVSRIQREGFAPVVPDVSQNDESEPLAGLPEVPRASVVEIPPRAIQFHNRYIVTATPDGIMLIDQHAMHERILFERLRHRVNANSVEIQRLLVPEPIDLRPAEASLLLENREHLERLGVLVEPFGGSTVLVHGLPAILFSHTKVGRIRADELIHEILRFIQQEGSRLSVDVLFDHILSTIACKAAVKAGQKLSREEMEILLDLYADCPPADHCPHGRPSVIVWTCAELDKMFYRT